MIKVEPPAGGDSSRANGPFPLGDGGGRTPGPDMESSALFLYLNAGKLGVTLNIATSTGRDLLLRMLEDADVLVENYPGARMRELGLDYPSLEDRFPRLVVTSITPFGHTGPYADYAAYDLNVQAAGGVSIGAGMPDREPLAIPYSQADYLAGLAGAASTLIALLARDATGRGQAVDVAASQVLAVLISSTYFLPNFIYRGVAGTRKGTRGGEAYFPNTIMRCKDGFVCLYPLRIEQYIRFLELIGSPEWQEEPRYRNRRAMAEEYPEEAEALIAPWFLERTKEEIFKVCQEHKVPCAPVSTIADVVNSEHLRERGYFVDIHHPVAGTRLHPGSPFRLSQTPGRPAGPAPLLGQHNQEVLCDRLGIPVEDLGRLRMAGVV